jgi:hypothetical protein
VVKKFSLAPNLSPITRADDNSELELKYQKMMVKTHATLSSWRQRTKIGQFPCKTCNKTVFDDRVIQRDNYDYLYKYTLSSSVHSSKSHAMQIQSTIATLLQTQLSLNKQVIVGIRAETSHRGR